MTSWLCMEALATQIRMTLAVAGSPDPNKATDCSPIPGLPYDNMVLNFNTDPSRGRTMDPDMVLSSSQVWMSPWPQMAVQATQISTAPVAVWPSDTSMTPDLGFHMAFNGNRNLRHQHRP